MILDLISNCSITEFKFLILDGHTYRSGIITVKMSIFAAVKHEFLRTVINGNFISMAL